MDLEIVIDKLYVQIVDKFNKYAKENDLDTIPIPTEIDNT